MSEVLQIIRREIISSGPIPFFRFMDLALYCPKYGYYEQDRNTVGPTGDFRTSVSTGPLFGQLLAFQLVKWMEQISGPRLSLVEAGAHRGDLSRTILDWIRDCRPDIWDRLTVFLIEPSPVRQRWQKATLADHLDRVAWIDSPGQPAPGTIDGILYANELLDAMPVRRLGWDARQRQWFEWGVALDTDEERDGGLCWTRLPLEPDSAESICKQACLEWTDELLELLPDGHTVDIHGAALLWWQAAAQLIGHGKLITLDYGWPAQEWLRPERRDGSVRAYRGHRVAGHVLDGPGEQDLTAHVNWDLVRNAGESAGLQSEPLISQERFLTHLMKHALESGFGPWGQEQTRQFQTLTHPDHFGRAFQVLVQSRGGE